MASESASRSSPRRRPSAVTRTRSRPCSIAAWSMYSRPGPDRRDSFFAETHAPDRINPRLYLGLAAQGRSLKVVMLRTYLALLGASQKAYDADGGKKNSENAADPYMTLLGYFNSLRELGGSRRIVEDEVRTRVAQYWRRKRREPDDRLFSDRSLSYEDVPY